jgi:hypothetical protein
MIQTILQANRWSIVSTAMASNKVGGQLSDSQISEGLINC